MKCKECNQERHELIEFAYQCPECYSISEIPCFNNGCQACGRNKEDEFEILYKLKQEEDLFDLTTNCGKLPSEDLEDE